MCNYNGDTFGFCVSCEGFDTKQACNDGGFITEPGKEECVDVCVKRDGDGGDELGFPCPSTDCWEFKAESGTCELKDIQSCTKVDCGSTSMMMEIGSGVFADSDTG